MKPTATSACGRTRSSPITRTAAAALVASTVAACATAVAPPVDAAAPRAPRYLGTMTAVERLDRVRFRGLVSWYGRRFHGRPTASGEPFDRHALTAAHRSLPFGTRLSVVDPESGKRVVVRVNDRGPYLKDRVLDLSRGAAEVVGIVGRGVAELEIEVLDSTMSQVPPDRYSVQVAAFADRVRAVRFRRELEADVGLLPAYIKPPDGLSRFHRVRVGPFQTPERVREQAAQLGAAGWDAVLVQEHDPGAGILDQAPAKPILVRWDPKPAAASMATASVDPASVDPARTAEASSADPSIETANAAQSAVSPTDSTTQAP